MPTFIRVCHASVLTSPTCKYSDSPSFQRSYMSVMPAFLHVRDVNVPTCPSCQRYYVSVMSTFLRVRHASVTTCPSCQRSYVSIMPAFLRVRHASVTTCILPAFLHIRLPALLRVCHVSVTIFYHASVRTCLLCQHSNVSSMPGFLRVRHASATTFLSCHYLSVMSAFLPVYRAIVPTCPSCKRSHVSRSAPMAHSYRLGLVPPGRDRYLSSWLCICYMNYMNYKMLKDYV